jgi:hypothetical protein
MASYSVASGEVAAYAKTLAASTVDTVTFTDDRFAVRVHNDTGSAAIFFTTDGSTPTVNGANCWRVPAVAGAFAEVTTQGGTATDVVKLISVGTPTYSVVGG